MVWLRGDGEIVRRGMNELTRREEAPGEAGMDGRCMERYSEV